MARGTRADEIRTFLLSRIADDTWRQGQRLPPEAELAELTETSRLSVREAVKVLTADGVLTVRHGTGTFVNPVSSWRSIDAVLAVQGADDDAATELMLELLVVRGYIEVGAAEACADRVTAREIALLEQHQAALRAAHESDDVAAATRADLAFHEVVLTGAGNPFVRLVLEPVSAALATVREQTSSVGRIREHAIAAHDAVLDALRERDRAAARRTMRAHMRETQQDVVRHLRSR